MNVPVTLKIENMLGNVYSEVDLRTILFDILGGGGSKIYFLEHGHVAYQIDWDDERNCIKIKHFYPRVKLVFLR